VRPARWSAPDHSAGRDDQVDAEGRESATSTSRSSYTSLYLSVVRSSGSGTLSYYGMNSGFNRTWAELWDRGDTDNWSDVA
jgi:hypothetical protein